MAVTRHVHKIECYPVSDNAWSSERFQQHLNNTLNGQERIIDIRWPRDNASSGFCWVITEEIVMGPSDGAQGK